MEICYNAIKANALYRQSVEDYIRNCSDITEFLVVRTVKGGAVKDGEPIGKVIRWYYSTSTDTAIHYTSNGNKVASSDGGKPLMNLPDTMPGDIDYERYLMETKKIMVDSAYEEQQW